MTLGKLIERFEDTILLPRTTKQIVWVSCGRNHEVVFVPASTVLPANMVEARGSCTLIQAYSTHNNLEKGLCVIKTKIVKQVNRMDRHKGNLYISLIILYIDLARAKSKAFINKFIM